MLILTNAYETKLPSSYAYKATLILLPFNGETVAIQEQILKFIH